MVTWMCAPRGWCMLSNSQSAGLTLSYCKLNSASCHMCVLANSSQQRHVSVLMHFATCERPACGAELAARLFREAAAKACGVNAGEAGEGGQAVCDVWRWHAGVVQAHQRGGPGRVHGGLRGRARQGQPRAAHWRCAASCGRAIRHRALFGADCGVAAPGSCAIYPEHWPLKPSAPADDRLLCTGSQAPGKAWSALDQGAHHRINP